MADYKELLRRAVDALPENNGAARRAVYEKARTALVGQLRAINPPLAARDITTHRLQLEDCIRQVEQEASEAMLAGMHHHDAPAPKPVQVDRIPAGGTIEEIIAAANLGANPDPAKTNAGSTAEATDPAKPAPMHLVEQTQAPGDGSLPPKPEAKPGARPIPSIVARAEAAKGRPGFTPFSSTTGGSYDAARRAATVEPRREAPRLDTGARSGQAAVARQPETDVYLEQPVIAAAMSAVREVEVEPQPDPQGAIDRAIATLDREARGDTEALPNSTVAQFGDKATLSAEPERKSALGSMFSGGARRDKPAKAERPPRVAKPPREARPAKGGRGRDNRDTGLGEAGFPRARAEDERTGISAITIFLLLFLVLLVGAGGAGYWAVSQGYLDLGSMFRSSPVAELEPVVAQPTVTAEASAPATGPGNTATTPEAAAPASELKADERLTPDPALTGTEPLALAATADSGKSEERLDAAGTDSVLGAANAEAAVAAIDPVNVPGSQSLLLEAADDGTTGAVPFSGTVDWSKGTDETGQPTLVGTASIPARNLGVDVLIRKNSDPSLPASHLMEINFRVSDSFIGGSVAGLPGVLLKNEELVQGAPLVGASARVVGNSFLFALSASPEDTAANNALLTSRKWMDLAVIYATGKRAIITLEKDAAAQTMFSEVFAAWGATASTK